MTTIKCNRLLQGLRVAEVAGLAHTLCSLHQSCDAALSADVYLRNVMADLKGLSDRILDALRNNRLISSLNDLIDRLERAELSERDASGVEQYKSSVTGVQSAIGEAGYNEAVREFLRRYNHFPTNYLALLADVDLPEVFA